jgi:hypothetical protein
MLLYCLAGGLPERINYTGILISRVERWIMTEELPKDPHYNYLMRILAAVDSVVESTLIIQSDKSLNPEDLTVLKNTILDNVFPLDASWNTDETVTGISELADLQNIRLARTYFFGAAEHYAASGTSAPSLSEAIKGIDRALRIIIDSCDKYNLIEFSANEWRENVNIVQKEVTG